MQKSDIIVTKDGHFRLPDPNYVFIKYDKHKAKIVPKNSLRPYEKIYYCDNCRALPAIQLDRMYEVGMNDFTLCSVCLQEDEEYLKKLEEEKNDNCNNA